MRFTVKLDEDVATGIKSEMERTRESFKQVVNRLLRQGFGAPEPLAGEHSKTGRAKRRKNDEGSGKSDGVYAIAVLSLLDLQDDRHNQRPSLRLLRNIPLQISTDFLFDH